MRSAPWYAGIALALIAIPVIVFTQLSTDASPAAAFCAAAERQGVPCKVGPKYDSAQVVVLTDPAGSPQGFMVISNGGKLVGTIPLQ